MKLKGNRFRAREKKKKGVFLTFYRANLWNLLSEQLAVGNLSRTQRKKDRPGALQESRGISFSLLREGETKKMK